jgi:hypothetical protein
VGAHNYCMEIEGIIAMTVKRYCVFLAIVYIDTQYDCLWDPPNFNSYSNSVTVASMMAQRSQDSGRPGRFLVILGQEE